MWRSTGRRTGGSAAQAAALLDAAAACGTAELEIAVDYLQVDATSFRRAALTAEGLGSPATLEIGNGFVKGHAEATLALIRRHPLLVESFA